MGAAAWSEAAYGMAPQLGGEQSTEYTFNWPTSTHLPHPWCIAPQHRLFVCLPQGAMANTKAMSFSAACLEVVDFFPFLFVPFSPKTRTPGDWDVCPVPYGLCEHSALRAFHSLCLIGHLEGSRFLTCTYDPRVLVLSLPDLTAHLLLLTWLILVPFWVSFFTSRDTNK